jgi:prolyl-tRNA synthetase
MGCYGIGVSRTLAAAAEQCSDENGLVWPLAIAPYHCVVVPLAGKDEAVQAAAARLCAELQAAGVDTVLDDRAERPGVKFKDADLIGFPLRLVIGAQSLAQGQVELKRRRTGAEELLPLTEAAERVSRIVREG